MWLKRAISRTVNVTTCGINNVRCKQRRNRCSGVLPVWTFLIIRPVGLWQWCVRSSCSDNHDRLIIETYGPRVVSGQCCAV